LQRYDYVNGSLRAHEGIEKTYQRPCDWAADCGPAVFLGGERAWTPAAQDALAAAASATLTPLRGLPDDFLVFAVGLAGTTPSVCGLACAATTLTVRFEDVWQLLPSDSRALSYTCAVSRDPHAKYPPSAQAAGIVRESIPGLAPDARICLDLADSGGFVLSFHPES
jgi:hypothetical protein